MERASTLGRPVFTHDIRLMAMAEQWRIRGRPFFGVIFAHLMQVTIGQCVRELELVAGATEAADWVSEILRIPL